MHKTSGNAPVDLDPGYVLVDLSTRVGTLELVNPIIAASGTIGYGDELSSYGDLASLGAVVTKSLAHFPWDGNPGLRLAPLATGMLNSVGLQGPGIASWKSKYLPKLQSTGAKIVVSIWGRTLEDFQVAVHELSDVFESLSALEVNLSCPNHLDKKTMFAQSPFDTQNIIESVSGHCKVPVWAKLSPAVANIVEICQGAVEGGAHAVTLVNTMPGMKIDLGTQRAVLGAKSGGISGPALHNIAVRCIYECRSNFPDLPIVGVGGVMTGQDAIELMLAGANAVQVGTASFLSPRSTWKIVSEIAKYCNENNISRVTDLVSQAHTSE